MVEDVTHTMTASGNEAIELQQQRVVTAGRQRIPTTEGVLHLVMRFGSLIVSFIFLGFIAAYAVKFDIILPVTYIAVKKSPKRYILSANVFI